MAAKASHHISAMLRKKTATVRGTGFPMPDKKHARLALQFENRAKPPLTPAERSKVENRAHRMLNDQGPQSGGGRVRGPSLNEFGSGKVAQGGSETPIQAPMGGVLKRKR